MLEREMSVPVAAWLRAKGLRVYSEVPCYGRSVDLVGVDPAGVMTAVELKGSLTHRVVRQALECQLIGRWCYCAVGRTPKSVARVAELGLGLLVVRNGVVHEMVRPTHQDGRWERQVEKAVRFCRGPESEDPGGTPSQAGDGPAVRCRALVDAYLAAHPGASWKEIWQAIPNHYQTARSMQGSMGRVTERIDAATRAREARDAVALFLREHPGATWPEIFAGIRCAYPTERALRGAIEYHHAGFYRRTNEALADASVKGVARG